MRGLRVEYEDFLLTKTQSGSDQGFAPSFMPDWLFDFRAMLVDWNIRRGRSATFADCGMGKTPMQLVVAENIVRETNKPVLVVTPLAVSSQSVKEAAKFDIDAVRSRDGRIDGTRIHITNYEKLHLFDHHQFGGVVCDESSAIKAFDGKRKALVTEFMRVVPYRLLCTATAAPNDYIELGTSSEALGELGYMDMLNRFFRNDQNTSAKGRMYGNTRGWRFKGHAEEGFWRWVSSWARAIRKPSDYGFDDSEFTLPPLIETEHIVETRVLADGMLFPLPATNMQEEREERRRTIPERCERAAELVKDTSKPAVVWCHLNDEANLLERLIPDGLQIAGSTPDERKEELFTAFADGEMRVLIIKPKIGAWGLNWQHCSHVVTFASHSYEQYYQAVRRCWRYGQTSPVQVDLIATEGEQGIKDNLRRKSEQASRMFAALVKHMRNAITLSHKNGFAHSVEVPQWL